MATVYVVTTGEYSDFRIRGIFDDRTLAQKFHTQVKSDNDVDEWTLNSIPKWAELGLTPFAVTFDGDANSTCEGEYPGCFSNLDESDPDAIDIGYSSKTEITVRLWAKDPAQAIKVASEKRARLLAEQGTKNEQV